MRNRQRSQPLMQSNHLPARPDSTRSKRMFAYSTGCASTANVVNLRNGFCATDSAQRILRNGFCATDSAQRILRNGFADVFGKPKKRAVILSWSAGRRRSSTFQCRDNPGRVLDRFHGRERQYSTLESRATPPHELRNAPANQSSRSIARLTANKHRLISLL